MHIQIAIKYWGATRVVRGCQVSLRPLTLGCTRSTVTQFHNMLWIHFGNIACDCFQIDSLTLWFVIEFSSYFLQYAKDHSDAWFVGVLHASVLQCCNVCLSVALLRQCQSSSKILGTFWNQTIPWHYCYQLHFSAIENTMKGEKESFHKHVNGNFLTLQGKMKNWICKTLIMTSSMVNWQVTCCVIAKVAHLITNFNKLEQRCPTSWLDQCFRSIF